MTDPLDVKARIKPKGLDNTGVTEEHAREMALRLGGHSVLIIEVRHDEVSTTADGQRLVKLAMTQVEPVPAAQEDTVREFMRAIYRSRPDREGQATLSGTADGPTVASAADALSAAVERGEDGEPTGTWDGDPEAPLTGPRAVPDPFSAKQ